MIASSTFKKRKTPIKTFKKDEKNIMVLLDNKMVVVNQLEIFCNQSKYHGETIKFGDVEVGSQIIINNENVVKSYLELSKKIPGNFLPSEEKCAHILCKYNLVENKVTTAVAINLKKSSESVWVALEQVVSESKFFYENVTYSFLNHMSIVCFFLSNSYYSVNQSPRI
jgi:hypothetical protein